MVLAHVILELKILRFTACFSIELPALMSKFIPSKVTFQRVLPAACTKESTSRQFIFFFAQELILPENYF
jgi:hypothetical protein